FVTLHANAQAQVRPHARSGFLREGNPRPVLNAALRLARARRGTLALVLEAEGPTYAAPGAMAAFDGLQGPVAGWLTGGSMEAELARRAAEADASGHLEWLQFDGQGGGRAGAGEGWTGQLRIALLPLRSLPGVEEPLAAWLEGGVSLRRSLSRDGRVRIEVDGRPLPAWHVPAATPAWRDAASASSPSLLRPPQLLLLGAGPEPPPLPTLLRHPASRRSCCLAPGRRPRRCCDCCATSAGAAAQASTGRSGCLPAPRPTAGASIHPDAMQPWSCTTPSRPTAWRCSAWPPATCRSSG